MNHGEGNLMKKTNQCPKKILIVLTGGTICSFENEKGEQESDTKKAKALIISNFRKGDSVFRDESKVKFDTKCPLDILSENMTVRHWNTFLRKLKGYDFSQYDGVIVLHGTDTLAYSASLLSLVLAGIEKPVFLISSQLPLDREEANGNENFKVAVEHIVKGIEPNVYVAYRNDEVVKGKPRSQMYLHFASHLHQCSIHSDCFYSEDMYALKKGGFFKGKASPKGEAMLYQCGALKNCVLKLEPYVGLDYSRVSLKGIKAVLHHTYHSGTMAVNPYHKRPSPEEEKTLDFTKDSILYLKRRCDAAGVELYIEPCNEKRAYLYDTTGIVLRQQGVGTSWTTTSEMAYVKLLIGLALNYKGEALQGFMNREINGEFVRPLP